MQKRALTGSRVTGSPHIGNFFGAYKPAIELGKQFELFFFLADFHSLDDLPSREKLRRDSYDMIATMLACGIDPEQDHLFAQSAVPEVAELSWMLSCVAPYGVMQRSVAFKDAQAKGADINMGIFNYPILMAADILLYDPDFVPVGKDQKQHLEMARDFGQKFNARYGKVFKIPEPLISEEVGLIPGCDGRKMSKSKNNVISVFATDKQWKKQIMSIETSCEGLADPKDPDACTVYNLFKLVAIDSEVMLMADRYRSGGYGYGHAKIELLKKVIETFSDKRDVYDDWMQRPDDLRDVILEGSKIVRKMAVEKLSVLHDKVGLIGRPFRN